MPLHRDSKQVLFLLGITPQIQELDNEGLQDLQIVLFDI